MNIRLGIYEIFSRIVPGGFYMLVFSEFSRVLGGFDLDWKMLKDIGVLPSLGLLIIAYVLGAAMDQLGYLWLQIFRNRRASPLERFKESHMNHWSIDFKDSDLPILRAYIDVHNPDIGEEIDRLNAFSIMLRSLSFGLVLLAVSEVIRFANTNDLRIAVLVVVLSYFSYRIVVQARHQYAWFHSKTLEVIMAYRLNLEDHIRPKKNSSKKQYEK